MISLPLAHSGFHQSSQLNLQLYCYLERVGTSFVCFGRHLGELPLFSTLPSNVASYLCGDPELEKQSRHDQSVVCLRWAPGKKWNQQDSTEFHGLKFEQVVFLFSIELVPEELIRELETHGCREFIYREGYELRRVDSSRSRRGFSTWLRQFRKCRHALTRALGTKVEFGKPGNLFRSGANYYKIQLPNRSVDNEIREDPNAPLLLFENEARLVQLGDMRPDALHISRGHYCRAGSELIFTPTDNSTPASNGKCYRVVSLEGPLKPLGRFFYPQAELLPTIEISQTSFERFAVTLRNCWYKMGTQWSGGTTDIVCLYTDSLAAGGAQRQAVYLAKHLIRAGTPVQLLLSHPPSDSGLHYQSLLSLDDIPILHLTAPYQQLPESFLHSVHERMSMAGLFSVMPDEMAQPLRNLLAHLMVARPRVLHCWLDFPNLIGAIAGCLAGVPTIILSTRNLNPTHFPRFLLPWFRQWYQLVADLPQVKLTGNSIAGIESYADWLGIPASRFTLVRNGIDLSTFQGSDEETVRKLRRDLCTADTAPVVLGIFRLDPEKRPFLFLEVVKQIKARVPELRVLIAGEGTLNIDVLRTVQEMNATGWITLLGRRTDIPAIISASDIVLLTSSCEGTPNALLEAQGLGRPVVCTDVGGVREVVEHDSTGFVCGQDDLDGMVECCCSLLLNRELQRKMGEAARAFIRKHLGVEQMVENTLACYDLNSSNNLTLCSQKGY